ncbi:transcriptional regulator with XRE-family HTH domain [Krasilnikovia cinnamomea]|uniref:Transcriptional regulator with XRE-family HTH domain n=1 Tax=Krasilnikovia cinnamomea TaxID=349313 RepID=A0A4Q7ZD26_9ACTN|nr:helix-turn-helix transcriptional regulator [Krasilnikovia cinnamomea]RZU48582.1 transcriptional regulator with XRE-family HTH domain [Krasilnikovia cinnamomea]
MNPLQKALDGPEGLRARLRELRVQAGKQQQEIAAITGWSHSKVSRIESGRTKPSADDIRRWITAVNGPRELADTLVDVLVDAESEHRSWKSAMRAGQEPVQAGYLELARRSHTIKDFELTAVPGMLQTPAYARAMFDEMVRLHQLTVADVDKALTARLERQELLYTDRRFEFLLAQPVLEWLLCPPSVMRAQLTRLLPVIAMPNVRFGILPTGVRLRRIPQNTTAAFIGDDETVVAVETFATDIHYYGTQAAQFVAAIDELWADAVEGEVAMQLVVQARDALPND